MNAEELLQRLQKSKPLSQKRTAKVVSSRLNSESCFIIAQTESKPDATDSSPEGNWKRRKNEIIASLQRIQGKEMTSEEERKVTTKTIDIKKEEMLMNVQLMNGEIPKTYQDLLTRFKVADIFLKRNAPRLSRLNDINNYMVLSDCKLSFTEKHVQSIVFLYPYSEKDVFVAYILGRTHPKIPTDHSILTLKIPIDKKATSVKDQVLSFLGSSRNLSGVFTSMKEEGRKDVLEERYDLLERHVKGYIDQQYKEYLERNEIKAPEKGRVASFTMKELGEMPLGELPPPIVLQVKSAKNALEELKRDVDKAVGSLLKGLLDRSKRINCHLYLHGNRKDFERA